MWVISAGAQRRPVSGAGIPFGDEIRGYLRTVCIEYFNEGAAYVDFGATEGDGVSFAIAQATALGGGYM